MNEAFHFKKLIYIRSSATEFIIEGNTLIPPFNAIPGLGTNAPINIVKAREEGEFLIKRRFTATRKSFKNDFGISWIIKVVLESLPDQNQLHCSRSFFLLAHR